MARYKTLNSVGHNIAHSMLSLMNYEAGEYFIQRLFLIAQKTGRTKLQINVLDGTIFPNEFNSEIITNSIKRYKVWLPSMAEEHNTSVDLIDHLVINVNFHLENTAEKDPETGLDLESYDCEVVLIDDRNNEHKSKVVEWWKY